MVLSLFYFIFFLFKSKPLTQYSLRLWILLVFSKTLLLFSLISWGRRLLKTKHTKPKKNYFNDWEKWQTRLLTTIWKTNGADEISTSTVHSVYGCIRYVARAMSSVRGYGREREVNKHKHRWGTNTEGNDATPCHQHREVTPIHGSGKWGTGRCCHLRAAGRSLSEDM